MRVTQLTDVTLPAPDIQEQILFAESADGVEPMSDSALRAVAHSAVSRSTYTSRWRRDQLHRLHTNYPIHRSSWLLE
jgi:hypothetical protein